jgi:putative hemolysin
VEAVAATVGFKLPAMELKDGDYRTLAGFVMHRLGHLPKEGEVFEHAGHKFEVVDMDRQRIDKVVIRAAHVDPAQGHPEA